jgi:deoxyribodipyrimidine photo-lyase
MSDNRPIIVWFRQDLRLADQPALAAAAASDRPVLPLFILDEETPGRWRCGGASRWWLHGSLAALAAALGERGSRLILRRGPAVPQLLALARETGAAAIAWNRHVEPFWVEAEAELARRLDAAGIAAMAFDGQLLFPAGSVRGKSGGPPRVFTPFWRACLARTPPAAPQPAPSSLRPPVTWPETEVLDAWRLTPTRPDWAGGLRETWMPGETAAQARLAAFIAAGLAAYGKQRNTPHVDGTSRLSPHLHWGEISVRQVWHACRLTAEANPEAAAGAEAFLRELGWREFCATLLRTHPQLPDEPVQPRFAAFPWQQDEALMRAWTRGRTGYPIVDAGMRQLWHTGWMHNRVRMIVASFLTKHLLQPWQAGEAWFWDTLVDADLANNAGGWQWVAGCGVDAAPYFRIFNPVLQGETFDPAGHYVRRWVPELGRVPSRFIHKPWQAPPLDLAAAGVRLGHDYPLPVIEHGAARRRALAAFAALDREHGSAAS